MTTFHLMLLKLPKLGLQTLLKYFHWAEICSSLSEQDPHSLNNKLNIFFKQPMMKVYWLQLTIKVD
jgi:hypothetical protein